MEPTVLREGDRVVLRQSTLWAPAGAKGTIVRTYGARTTVYSVRFDGQTQEWAVPAAALEPIDACATPRQARDRKGWQLVVGWLAILGQV